MSFDEPLTDLPSVLSDVAEVMAYAHEELDSEHRAELINELHDCVLFERRHINWWERMGATNQLVDVVFQSGRRLSGLTVQHACEDFVIARDERFSFVFRSSKIQLVTGLSAQAYSAEHRQLTCGIQSLSFAESSGSAIHIELTSDNLLSGYLCRIWKDSVDVTTNQGVVTVPFQAIEFIRLET